MTYDSGNPPVISRDCVDLRVAETWIERRAIDREGGWAACFLRCFQFVAPS